ncbi:unnamed protein product [Adineta ricciae]|uniref:Reverse transcriptase n=1 Tax=Adineta ricciae TaxID=249248 RepID=A0A815TJ51_ADIRI|nr:unnamed protein product [Adineta ricciae]
MTSTQDSAMMICYRECLSNLEKFNGSDERKTTQFIHYIERIGKMINARGDILYSMCTAKLDGEAKRWYDNNTTLDTWETLKPALVERFTTTDSSSKVFEQLKERKQKPEETVTSYYDTVIKLCHEYDPTVSQKMIISWLENGLYETLKIPVKRQMKSLAETARTAQTFLKIAKAEQELQHESVSTLETTTYTPYFTDTVSATLPKPGLASSGTTQSLPSSEANAAQEEPDGRRRYGYTGARQHVSVRTQDTLTQQRSSAWKKHGTSDTQTRNNFTTQASYGSYTRSTCRICGRGEIKLEVRIQGHKTTIFADVATNLIIDLLLGNDWITNNNVIIDSPQRCIHITDHHRRIKATAFFLKPHDLQTSVLLTEDITLPPYSEVYIDINIPSPRNVADEIIFEPDPHFYSKQIFPINALLTVENQRSKIMIINGSDQRRTLSRNTKLGYASSKSDTINHLVLTIPASHQEHAQTATLSNVNERNAPLSKRSCYLLSNNKRKVPNTDFACRNRQSNVHEQHQCYVCQQQFLSRNGLQQHLRDQCYPQDIREKIEKLTIHIENQSQREKLQRILWKYGKLYDLRQPSIIKRLARHAIETGTHPPVYAPPYRVSYKDEQIQKEEIDKLLQQGIIQESKSPWSSPIVLVRKKDGSVRFCIDFRKLNNITTKDAFPLPRIDDIFDHLSKAGYYSAIDFKSGYFQGVTNGAPTFQRIVSQILGPARWKYSLAYLDDVIIYSTTFNQHLIHLDDILNRLNDANFRLNVNKCQIAKTAIDYLGHHIERSSIRPNADNIRALRECPQPITAKEAFRFLKATEYYRKFIPRFSMIAEPLYKYAPVAKDQRSKGAVTEQFTLTDEALNAFQELKRILTEDLILRISDERRPFKIQTDASKIGIGAVLMQTYANGDLPVAYISKKFTTTQMNWPATEQECYAIIYAIEKWHKYLDGRPFTIETDHKPLLPFNRKRQLNAKCE